MNDNQRREAIKQFVDDWKERGSEKSDAQSFWLELVGALGVKQPTKFIRFEHPVVVEKHMCFIDAYISETKVLIEQKSRGIDLDKPARQSDGKFLTPFQQAKRYAAELPALQLPRWIVTCNFDELRIYDLGKLSLAEILDASSALEPQRITFDQLPEEFSRLNFLVDPKDDNVYPEIKISKKAAAQIGKFRSEIKNAWTPQQLERWRDSLNRFCVRLVFCLYAEDAHIDGFANFRDYIRRAQDKRQALIDLFRVLDTPKNLRAERNSFPYVNGDLFRDAADDIPPFRQNTLRHILGENDSGSWAKIDTTIFGALFESDLNHDVQHGGGMYYTSAANIHKLIYPLFLNDLDAEFRAICRKRKDKRSELENFQSKLASLKFFDPACGSGNFLTETYLLLRRLENEVLRELRRLDAPCTVQVLINQFFGIEQNDFACAIARTAMWIAESQMLHKSEMFLTEQQEDLFPLKHSAQIVCGNALRIDWKELAPNGVDYIIGNPPFVGHQWRTPEQVADMSIAFHDLEKHGKLDYVCAWYNKAADFMLGNETRAAFVSTNSICQGESVGILWRHLFDKGLHIDFARRTFKWTQEPVDDRSDQKQSAKTSERDETAAVHCVIVGFSHALNKRQRLIFDGDNIIEARNINGYLLNAPDVFIQNRGKPLTPGLPIMTKGSQPTEGGHLLLTPEERKEFLRLEPRAEKFIRPFIGAEEFINGKMRYCLWLVHATPDELKMPQIAMRLEDVRRARLKSKTKSVREAAATPHLFTQIRRSSTNYLAIPEVSSHLRKYIPIGFMPPTIIASNKLYMLRDVGLFEFGVLESIVHMAWMRVVTGRLGNGYMYSPSVYNNFVWCAHSPAIERTAQSILDVRSRYSDRSLAFLYDETTMPDDLRAAHDANDAAVLSAYGFSRDMSEAEIVSRLMEMYSTLDNSPGG